MTSSPPGGDLFEQVYRTSGTAVLGYALCRCVSCEDALDIVAETGPAATRAWPT